MAANTAFRQVFHVRGMKRWGSDHLGQRRLMGFARSFI